MNLSQKKCVPCEGGALPMVPQQIQEYIAQVPGWSVVEDKKIKKEFMFPNFLKVMAFVDRVAVIAEEEGHHPDIHIFYNKVVTELWTHAIVGLSENDFILASKINNLEAL